jgi:hypothetical protein
MMAHQISRRTVLLGGAGIVVSVAVGGIPAAPALEPFHPKAAWVFDAMVASFASGFASVPLPPNVRHNPGLETNFGSEPSNGGVHVYADTIDIRYDAEASEWFRAARENGVQAAQSLSRLSRFGAPILSFRPAYDGGSSPTRMAPLNGDVGRHADANGISLILRYPLCRMATVYALTWGMVAGPTPNNKDA